MRTKLPRIVRHLDAAFVRSAVTSGAATATDFVVACTLVALATAPGVATLIGCVAGGIVAFSVNRTWAFRAEGKALPQVFRFLGVWASSAALNSVGVTLALRFAGAPFAVVWLLVRGVVFSAWNYPMLRWFVFRSRSQPEPQPAVAVAVAAADASDPP